MPAAREGLSSPPPDRLTFFFFFIIFFFLNSERFTISVFHKTTWQVAAKHRKMDIKKKEDCKCINHDCFNLGRCRQRNQWTYSKTSSVNHVCTSVLVCACSVWLLDVHRLLCGIPRRTCGSGLSWPRAFTSESQWT